MKTIKMGMVLVCTTVFVLSALTAAATTITDGTGDVWHWSQTGTIWGWSGNVVSKPNIDITQMTANVVGNQFVLTMTVSGVIENSDKIGYWIYYNTSDMDYWAWWSNGYGMGFGSQPNQTTMPEMAAVTATGNTITAKFNATSVPSAQEFWGWAAESTGTLGSNSSEWWGDWAPNSELPFTPPGSTGGTTTGNNTGGNTNTGGNNNGTSSGSKTPGFELVPVVAAVAIAAILLRRRR
jgi:hypothetical protein